LALFFGGFSLLNLVARGRSVSLDATLWWIDLRSFPPVLAVIVLAVAAICLIFYAVRPPTAKWARLTFATLASGLALKALVDSAIFYWLLGRQVVHAAVPVPFSLLVAAAMALIAGANLRGAPRGHGLRQLFLRVAVCCACLGIFPVGQMFCFGKTDYRRPADVAVVFGARVYKDGRLSDALGDRVRTACALYQQGLARKLLMSGGPGDGAIHETEAMKQMAMRLGVKESDILVDREGINTQATVRNSGPIFRGVGASRVLVVSHFYHLPRIKLAYQRAGVEVYTVPAKESYVLRQLPYNMAREVAALWVYYLRPIAQG
jgi:vancomycin permeability regulator SanA